MKVNWRLLGKSLIACIAGAFFGTPLFLFGHSLIRAFYDAGGVYLPVSIAAYTTSFWSILPQFIFVAFIFLLIFGLPAQAALQYFKRTSYLSNIVFAAIGGLIVQGAASYAMGHFFTALSDPLFAMSGTAAAVCIGSIAWLVRRPDKDERKQQIPTGANP